MRDKPGATFRDGGPMFGGPMNGKSYRHCHMPYLVFNTHSLPRWTSCENDRSPVRLVTARHRYEWDDFLGGYLYTGKD